MAESTSINLLDADAVARAEALGVLAREVVEGYMAGEHASPFRGFSIEFTQHREYVPGDDLRHLDWKVLGRTDRYYLKQYEQETNFVAHILVDGSQSMRYGSGLPKGGKTAAPRSAVAAGLSKFDYARRLAACLAYVVLHQRDAVSLALFDDRIRGFVPRTGNLSSFGSVAGTLSSFDPQGGTGIADVLHQMAGQIRRRGIVILISDLFDDEQRLLDGVQHIRFGGSEVIVFHVLDPFELEFPFDSAVEFEGLEQMGILQTRPRDIRKTYLAEMDAFRRRIAEGCERNRSHYTLLNTRTPLNEALPGYLAFRRKATAR